MDAAIDGALCQRIGYCARVAPEVFEMADDGPTRVRAVPIEGDLRDAVREAEALCPARAIRVTEDPGA